MDHARTLTLAVADGAMPSSEGRSGLGCADTFLFQSSFCWRRSRIRLAPHSAASCAVRPFKAASASGLLQPAGPVLGTPYLVVCGCHFVLLHSGFSSFEFWSRFPKWRTASVWPSLSSTRERSAWKPCCAKRKPLVSNAAVARISSRSLQRLDPTSLATFLHFLTTASCKPCCPRRRRSTERWIEACSSSRLFEMLGSTFTSHVRT